MAVGIKEELEITTRKYTALVNGKDTNYPFFVTCEVWAESKSGALATLAAFALEEQWILISVDEIDEGVESTETPSRLVRAASGKAYYET